MSDDSVPGNATDPQDAPKSTTAPTPESVPGKNPAKRGHLRQLILIGLLGLMALALAYDYRIARPNVDRAYDQIVELNDRMNITASAKPTLNTDIHQEMGRGPDRQYTHGQYRIEVFSWMAGIPFRTHDLFAVYVANGNDLVFMWHYKFVMPDEELNTPTPKAPGAMGEDPVGVVGGMPGPPRSMTMEGPIGGGRGRPGGGGEGRGQGRPQRPGGDGEDENAGAEEGSPISPESPGDAPPASPPSDDAAPGDAAPDASAPEASTTPADKPADAQSPAKSNPAPAASEAKKKDA